MVVISTSQNTPVISAATEHVYGWTPVNATIVNGNRDSIKLRLILGNIWHYLVFMKKTSWFSPAPLRSPGPRSMGLWLPVPAGCQLPAAKTVSRPSLSLCAFRFHRRSATFWFGSGQFGFTAVRFVAYASWRDSPDHGNRNCCIWWRAKGTSLNHGHP